MLAAGILFLTPDKKALFLKRGPGGDHAGEWCFPGGKVEEGEKPIDAAKREVREECGFLPDGAASYLTRRIAESDTMPGEQVDFTTYSQNVPKEFAPQLDDESVGFAWAPIDEPPQPLHPGCFIALARLSMNELDIARAMASGDLTSPQRYQNVTLYNIRITGTGVSYRPSLDEFVYRKPENYLTDEFLARCNGLPVIFVHPEKSLLNSNEFSDRAVGTVMLPYIRGDEVWAIAKLYDDETIALLEEQQMSTSPAVLLGKSTKLKMEDGKQLLVEGEPTLVDHLAIVRAGVWDKGGEPTGIEANFRGDSVMAEMDKKEEDKARADADARLDEKLDMMLKGIDSLRSDMASCNSRMDSFEDDRKREDKARKDAADKEEEDRKKADASRKDGNGEAEDPEKEKAVELAADKARKDAEGEKEKDKELEKARADSVDLRAQLTATQEQIKALAARIPKDISDAEYMTMVGIQARADEVYTALGERAPRPLSGESPVAYERRLASGLKKHSDRWKGINLDVLPEEAFPQIRDQVYADAAERARMPNDIAAGKMREVTKRSETGHIITEFYAGGDTHFVKQFARNVPRVRGFRFES